MRIGQYGNFVTVGTVYFST